MSKRVVITGLGPVSCIGRDRETFWQSLIKGVSGIRKIEHFANSELGYKSHIGGDIPDFTTSPFVEEKQAKRFSRFTNMSLVAAYLALADAHLKIDEGNSMQTGVIFGTGIGGLEIVEDQAKKIFEKDLKKLNPFTANATVPQAAAAEISNTFGIRGYNFTVSTGCSASANAIGVALDNIRNGRSEIVLVGGAEAPFTDVIFSSFDITKQLSTKNDMPEKAVTPFSLGRDGFVLSEGGAVIILEELDHALARGAYIYGELIGYGSSGDAYHSYKHELDGTGMAYSMDNAIKDAGITPFEIDYICAHGSGSSSGDLKETNAIKRLFLERAKQIPVSSIKAAMGMPFGASTGFQLIAAALMLDNQKLVPTLNVDNPDPECDLDYIPNQSRDAVVNYIMINSMGLGGNNASLIVRKFKAK